MFGTAPMPITTSCAGSSTPELVITPLTWPPAPTSSDTPSPNRNVTPWLSCSFANTAPISGPTERCSAPGSGSTTVTSQPYFLAAAAVSRPIQPAPAITTRPPPFSASRSARESSIVRRYSTPPRSAPGTLSRRGEAPVESSSLA